jgi:hypothetical protein
VNSEVTGFGGTRGLKTSFGISYEPSQLKSTMFRFWKVIFASTVAPRLVGLETGGFRAISDKIIIFTHKQEILLFSRDFYDGDLYICLQRPVSLQLRDDLLR